MLSLEVHPSTYTTETQQAFDELKRLFSSPPTLLHPDTERPFGDEMDADVGVSTILSQVS